MNESQDSPLTAALEQWKAAFALPPEKAVAVRAAVLGEATSQPLPAQWWQDFNTSLCHNLQQALLPPNWGRESQQSYSLVFGARDTSLFSASHTP